MIRSLLHSLVICALLFGLCAVLFAPTGSANATSTLNALNVNAIANPGAENQFTSWDYTSNAGYKNYGASESPSLTDPGPQNRGNTFFWGNQTWSGDTNVVEQSISVGNAVKQQIEGGKIFFKLSGYLGGYGNHQDHAAITVEFRDYAQSKLSSKTIGPVTATNRENKTGLFYREASGPVPANTQYIFITVTFTNVTKPSSNDYNYGFADDLAIVLYKNQTYLPMVVRPPSPPAAPSNLTAAAVSSTAINLSWKDNSDNESGFQIERAPINTSLFALVTTTGANVTSYQNSGLTPNTGYTYRVRSINSGGVSAYTTTASATTPIAPPAAPSGLNASGTTANTTTLKWTDNANNETGFELQMATGTGGFLMIKGADVLTSNTNQTTVSSLSPGTTYKFRIRAVNQGGNSTYSNEVQVTTQSALPAAPTNLAYSNLSSTTVTLSWVDNASNETWFELQEKIGTGAWTTISNPTNLPANYVFANITDLVPNTDYAYKIRAVNNSGASAFSNTVSFRTPPASGQTILRVFNNGTVDWIVSLKINNAEYLPTPNDVISKGYYKDFVVTPGSINIVATTGLWDTQANPPRRIEKYSFSFGGTIDAGTTETVTVNDPAIEFLLTQPYTLNPVRRAWIGTYWIGTKGGVATFCFYPNGKYRLLDNGVQVNAGPYTMVQYGALATYFQADDPVTKESYIGTLDMTSGGAHFYMKNGPPQWKQIDYWWQTDANTLNSGCPTTSP